MRKAVHICVPGNAADSAGFRYNIAVRQLDWNDDAGKPMLMPVCSPVTEHHIEVSWDVALRFKKIRDVEGIVFIPEIGIADLKTMIQLASGIISLEALIGEDIEKIKSLAEILGFKLLYDVAKMKKPRPAK